MKASKLLEEIKYNLEDFDIDYLRNKVTDERYKDPLTKELARYNSSIYDEIFEKNIEEDFEIKNKAILNLKNDINAYFAKYNPHDEENQNFTKYLSLYLAFIAKKPLHPYREDSENSDVFKINNEYFCKGRVRFIKDRRSLCKYCCCKNAPFGFY